MVVVWSQLPRLRVVRAELEPSSSLEPRHPRFSSALGTPSPGVPPKPPGPCAHAALLMSPRASGHAAGVGREGAPRYLRPSELVSAA